MPSPTLRHNIFISYSHADKAWLERLKIHLAPILRGEKLHFWDDSKIRAGSNWESEINEALSTARVAILLVTPNFLASDYVTNVELPSILARAEKDLAVLWIPVAPSSYQATPLKSLQAAHDPKYPLSTLSRPKQDDALVAIAKKVSSMMDVNAIGNALKLIDTFTPEVIAFVSGSPDPTTSRKYQYYAEQQSNSVNLVEPGGTTKLINAEDLERLDPNAQKLIRAYERAMKELFERWTELKPKRIARDPETRAEAVSDSDQVRRELCSGLD